MIFNRKMLNKSSVHASIKELGNKEFEKLKNSKMYINNLEL